MTLFKDRASGFLSLRYLTRVSEGCLSEVPLRFSI